MKVQPLTEVARHESRHNGYSEKNWASIRFDWNRTRSFLVVAEEGTISAAAIALNVSQPTVSRQIAELEKELGVSLFKRSVHRISLTSHGKELFEVVREMGLAAGKFSKLASVKSDSIGGKVVISACEMSVVYRLPTIIAKLRELEPEINVEVIVASDPNAMQQHESDIAICSVKPSYPNYIIRKVGIESRSLFGSRDYIQLNDVNNIDIGKKDIQIISKGDFTELKQHLAGLVPNVAEKNCMVSTRSEVAQLNLCLEGLGLALLPHDVVNKAKALQVVVGKKLLPIEKPVWLVCSSDLRRNRSIETTFNFVANELTKYFLESSFCDCLVE